MQFLAPLFVVFLTMHFAESMTLSDLRRVVEEIEANRKDFLYAFEYGWSRAPTVYDYDDLFSTVPALYY